MNLKVLSLGDDIMKVSFKHYFTALSSLLVIFYSTSVFSQNRGRQRQAAPTALPSLCDEYRTAQQIQSRLSQLSGSDSAIASGGQISREGYEIIDANHHESRILEMCLSCIQQDSFERIQFQHNGLSSALRVATRNKNGLLRRHRTTRDRHELQRITLRISSLENELRHFEPCLESAGSRHINTDAQSGQNLRNDSTGATD